MHPASGPGLIISKPQTFIKEGHRGRIGRSDLLGIDNFRISSHLQRKSGGKSLCRIYNGRRELHIKFIPGVSEILTLGSIG